MMTLMRQIALGRWNLGRTTSAGSPFVHFRRGVASLGLFAACIQPHLEAAPAAGAMPDGAPRLIRLVAGATRAYDRASAGVAAAHAAGKRGEPFSMRRTEWLVPNRRPVAKSARLEAVLDEYSNGREEASFYVTPGGLSAYFVVSGRKRAAFVFQRWAGSRVLEFTLRHGIRSPAAKSLIRALRQCTNGNIPAWFASTQRALPPPVSVSVPIPRLPGHFRVFSYYPMLRFGHFRASIRPCRVVWFSRGAETILRL